MSDQPSFAFPQIPERISSLMAPTRRNKMNSYQLRSVSAASQASTASQSSVRSTVSDFLSSKIEELTSQTDYLAEVRDGLFDAKNDGSIDAAEFDLELKPVLKEFKSLTGVLHHLKRQQNVLTEDLHDAVEMEKRRRLHGPPDAGLLERAYTDAIVKQIMHATAHHPKSTFDRKDFKRKVNDYYGVAQCARHTWCHVLGALLEKSTVKAAHLVPKSMELAQLAHLFGDQETVITAPQNGLSLHKGVEALLDNGDIVIVPMPGEFTSPTSWRCVVLNNTIKDQVVWQSVFPQDYQVARRSFLYKDEKPASTVIHVKDLDGRELEFLSENRPRRRYLYLRFIVSYLWAKRRNLPNLKEKVEVRHFWPSDGSYLHRSTLQTIARCVSGCEIPEELVTGQTFEESVDPSSDSQIATCTAVGLSRPHIGPDLYGALSETMKDGSKAMKDD